MLTVGLAASACSNVSPTVAVDGSTSAASFPERIDDMRAWEDVAMSDLFTTAEFEVRQGGIMSQEQADESGQDRTEKTITTTVGRLDFAQQQLVGTQTYTFGWEGEDSPGPVEVYGDGDYFHYRSDDEQGREIAGSWPGMASTTFALLFDRTLEFPGSWKLLEERDDELNPLFESLGAETVRDIDTSHYRLTRDVESNTDLWGGGKDIITDQQMSLWLDEAGRPVRTRLTIPITDAHFVYEVDFWNFDKPVDLTLPGDLDIRPDGEPFGETRSSVSHSTFGDARFGPERQPYVFASDSHDEFTRIELRYPLPATETHTHSLHVHFYYQGDDPVGTYPAAEAWTGEFYATVVPDTFVTWVESTPVITEDLPAPPPITRVECPGGAPLAGELRVLSAAIDDHNGHTDVDRIHVEFTHECELDGETVVTTGEYLRNA